MPLSWNEIRHRAIKFSKEYENITQEDAESQSFWNDFFYVFDVKRRTVASFEEPVKKLSGDWGYIDLFWPATLLVEHKSTGKNLDKAESQGMEYIRALKDSGREKETPRFLIISDFARIALHDLEADRATDSCIKFPLKDLPKHIRYFAFIAGYKQHKLDAEDPVNIEAVELMCQLHDALDAGGYQGHELKRFLVRILFCLFAEDTGIFQPQKFQIFLEDRTTEDGSDLGVRLAQLFEVLNTPDDKRQKNLDEHLREFPYINGELFSESLHFANFTSDMRKALLACAHFDWSRISPAVFGSLFQSVMEPKERRQIGAHYTSEKNILKLARSLFLNELHVELDSIRALKASKNRDKQLDLFREKLAGLKFLDPACGCGNFLVISYRELRRLELETLKLRFKSQLEFTLDDVNKLSKLDVDQMYGIEIEEFPARIAEVALWLMDHQMNIELSEAFSQFYLRIPLRKSPHICIGNALRLNWREVLSIDKCSYILGNPPFVGKKEQTVEQKSDMDFVWQNLKGAGILDYVTGWYKKASEYMQGTGIKAAFVSTNSITQGEQVGLLWHELFNHFHIKIHFAHTTFAWESEARGKAHVHVVIIGFGAFDAPRKIIFEYDTPQSEGHIISAKNINPYLADAPDVTVLSRNKPLNGAPEISYGSMMIDKDRKAGDEEGLILTSEQRKRLMDACPDVGQFIRRLYGGDEFLNGIERWCLWLVEAPPSLIHSCPLLRERIGKIKRFRLSSGRQQTRELAKSPTLFGEIRQPTSQYLLIPKVSSELRQYIPIGFVNPEIIASGSALIVPGAELYHFGILLSAAHNSWIRAVAGRLESRLQYSNAIVYNNFPWPESPTKVQKSEVEEAGQWVLNVREKFPTSTLADLYDPVSMPPELTKAHAELDCVVDRCYRKVPFSTDRERVGYLFALYEKINAPLAIFSKKRQKIHL